MNENNSYIVGTTLTLTAIVTPADSLTPVDASSVTLDALFSGQSNGSVPSVAFAHAGTGTYTLSLDTTGLAPGVWTWRAKAVNSAGTAFIEDTFVLRAPVGSVTVTP